MRGQNIVAVGILLSAVQTVTPTLIKRESTYIVVAPINIRPNQLLKVSATILKLEYDSFTVTALVRKLRGTTYDEICSTDHTFTRVGSHELSMWTREEMTPGNYTLRVAGYSDPTQLGQIFTNDTELFFDSREVTALIQLSKPFFRQGQIVRLRVVPLEKNLMAVSTVMDVKIKDPNGYTMREYQKQHTNAGGVVSLSYPLSSNLLTYGDWSVEVNCRGHIYNKTFRVEEFYAPLFYVNVSMPTVMLMNNYGISGIIASNHTTGRGTKGNCTIRLDVLSMADDERKAVSTLYRYIPYFDGRADFLFTSLEMHEDSKVLVGKELRVTATVKDWFYGTTAVGYQSALVYDKDVQLKFLGGSVWSFKPQLPFNIHIAAIKHDGTPLDPYNENRTINLEIIETDEITGDAAKTDTVEISTDTSIAEYWLSPKTTTRRIAIVAKYENQQDTRRDFVATKFWSPNDYYIQLMSPTKRPVVGQYMIFNVKTNTFIEYIFYHIVAAGNIIVSDKLQMYSRNKLFSVALSREMVPNARIIAYFVAPDGQMVVDSLNFYVNGSRLHEMSLRFNRGKDFSYNTIEITATADPLSYVAFSAIEYQLYELGVRNGLTWDEIDQELYSYETHANTSIHHYWMKNGQLDGSFHAPTPSFAHDANSTFFFAGLYVYTDANASAVYTACNKTEGKFPCMDGKSCYDYTDMCKDDYKCTADRQDAMGCLSNQTFNPLLYNDDRLWRTQHIRPFFLDGSFMWEDQFTKPDGRIDFKVDVPTFPTTWVVSGFAMSREHGLAMLPVPTQFDGVRPMYMTIEGPSRAKIGEHVSLRIVIFNFWDEEMDVLVSIPSSPDYQFVAVDLNADGQTAVRIDEAHQLLVPVFPGGNRQVYVPIRARTVGHKVIRVTASCAFAGQTVNHHLLVDHYGVAEHYITSLQVDLRRANSERLPDMLIPVREALVEPEIRGQNYVPGSPRTRIFAIGDIVGISYFRYVNYNLNSENLLHQPYGSGSEAVFNFAVNLYTLKMLRSLANVTLADQNRALYTLNIAMQEVLAYMQSDGSFKEFRWSTTPSTWLTATALNALSEGRTDTSDLFKVFRVPPSVLSKAAIWLSQQQDNVTGSFREVNTIYNKRYTSTINIDVDSPTGTVSVPANMSLTALCVIALAQAPDLAKDARGVASTAKQKGSSHIDKYIDLVQDPFELAVSTYSLQKSGRTGNVARTMQRLAGMARTTTGRNPMTYWSTEDIPAIKQDDLGQGTVVRLDSKQFSNVTAYAVAATSYVMLSYLVDLDQAAVHEILNPVQAFFQEQHMWVGGFASTQDTLIAMQALKTMAEKDQDRGNYAMSFTFESDQDEKWNRSFTLDQSNWFDLQVVDLPTHWGSIISNVKGHGVALVQMETTSNHEWREQLRKPFVDQIFTIGEYNANIKTRGFNSSYIDYKLCPRYNGGGRSGMSVLEVGIPSGYIVHNNTLQTYVQTQMTRNTTLRNAESYGGKAVFYFDFLDATDDKNCAQFSAVRWYPVANISYTHYIRVFEYYEPGNFNHTFYQKIEFRELTVCLTCGSYQCPYCPHYASGTLLTPSVLMTMLATVLVLYMNSYDGVRGPLKTAVP